MKKLVCKHCGNSEFTIMSSYHSLCNCGRLMKKVEDFKKEEPTPSDEIVNRLISSSNGIIAEIFLNISLLRYEINKSLDERNEETFYILSSELVDYEEMFKKREKEMKTWN